MPFGYRVLVVGLLVLVGLGACVPASDSSAEFNATGVSEKVGMVSGVEQPDLELGFERIERLLAAGDDDEITPLACVIPGEFGADAGGGTSDESSVGHGGSPNEVNKC